MKTLIEINETSALYEFTNGTATRRYSIRQGPQVTEEPVAVDFEAEAEAEHQRWLEWLNANPHANENYTPPPWPFN
jgi:hypothetical protein